MLFKTDHILNARLGAAMQSHDVTSDKSVSPPATAILGIDIGSTKIAVVVARMDTDHPEILGFATVPFNGSVWSGRSKAAGTADAINRVVVEACRMAECASQTAVIGISGIAGGINSIGLVAVNEIVSEGDIQNAITAASDLTIPKEMAVLDQVVNSFTLNLDEVEGIADPLGMEASSLEVVMHTLICRRTVLNTVISAGKLAGLNVLKVTSSEVASAKVLLTPEEQNKGVCLVDMGGEYTTVIAYGARGLQYCTSMLWGGNLLTGSIEFGLGISKTRAEKAIREYSKYDLNLETSVQDKAMHSFIQKHIHALCTSLEIDLIKSGLDDGANAGFVLSGGIAKLPGLPETIAHELELPVRRAHVTYVPWLKNISLEYASAVGLVMMGGSSSPGKEK
jgi:cell division protein FtsA